MRGGHLLNAYLHGNNGFCWALQLRKGWASFWLAFLLKTGMQPYRLG